MNELAKHLRELADEVDACHQDEWVDVTKECGLSWDSGGLQHLIKIQHDNRTIMILGLDGYALGASEYTRTNYRATKVYLSATCGWWFRIEKRNCGAKRER